MSHHPKQPDAIARVTAAICVAAAFCLPAAAPALADGSDADHTPRTETVRHDGVSYDVRYDGNGNGVITAPERSIPFHGDMSVGECDADGDGSYASSECPEGVSPEQDRKDAIVMSLLMFVVMLSINATVFLSR